MAHTGRGVRAGTSCSLLFQRHQVHNVRVRVRDDRHRRAQDCILPTVEWMLGAAIGAGAAVVYGNLMEWCIHKHILHGKRFGKKKGTFWAFHWGDHHKTCRKNGNRDSSYDELRFTWNELLGLLFGGLIHLPLAFLWPSFYVGLVLYMAGYWYFHRKSHVDVEWGKRWMPGHYFHHMGRNQDTNWNIFLPLFDKIFGTRTLK